jgi:enoyl-CoA hydratase/carnithine racemase
VSPPVASRVEGATGIVELSRPEKFNCLSVEVHEAIDAARQTFESDRAVRAILLRAQGKHFCTGADLAKVKAVIRNADDLDHFIGCGLTVLSRLEASTLPVVVAVQGLCLAGGIELMLAADICFAAKTAQFGDQHATFGLVPGWGGSQRLTRIIGLRRTLDLLYSARWMKAEEAHAMGLVNYVVPDERLHEEALAYCQTFATRSRPGIAEMKRLARQGADMTLEQSMRLERDAVVRHLQGADGAEGIASFDERRAPRFTQ